VDRLLDRRPGTASSTLQQHPAKLADWPARLLFERVGGEVVDNLTGVLGKP